MQCMSVCGKRTQAVEAPPPVPGAAAHLHLKGQTQKLHFCSASIWTFWAKT